MSPQILNELAYNLNRFGNRPKKSSRRTPRGGSFIVHHVWAEKHHLWAKKRHFLTLLSVTKVNARCALHLCSS